MNDRGMKIKVYTIYKHRKEQCVQMREKCKWKSC